MYTWSTQDGLVRVKGKFILVKSDDKNEARASQENTELMSDQINELLAINCKIAYTVLIPIIYCENQSSSWHDVS